MTTRLPEMCIYYKSRMYKVEVEDDLLAEPPWIECDGHGPVSCWENRPKRPGELVLARDGKFKLFYDFAEAVKIARKDKWGISNPPEPMTAKQIAAAAVRKDYEYLLGWINGDWRYVNVVVTSLKNGEWLSICRVEDSDEADIAECARDLAADLHYNGG